MTNRLSGNYSECTADGIDVTYNALHQLGAASELLENRVSCPGNAH